MSALQLKKPKRIQRKRTKGWRMPENTIYVGRPSKWGNPYDITEWRDREKAIALYREYVKSILMFDHRSKFLEALRGKDLACFCRLTDPCHADVLLEFLGD